jgi:SET domain-containing protein
VRRLNNRGRGGRGVFARQDIPAGTLIERAPVILMPRSDLYLDPAGIQQTNAGANQKLELSWYAFSWESITPDVIGLALGYGSIYNHSFHPNASYTPIALDLLDFRSLRPIAAGEEIFISYDADLSILKGEVQPVRRR